MKARVGAWTFRIVEVARPGLGSLSFGLSLSLSRTLSIAYRRHGSRISAWRRMAVVRTAYAARRERESSPAFDDPVWHPRALRGGGAVGNALTRESQAHLERNGAVGRSASAFWFVTVGPVPGRPSARRVPGGPHLRE